VTGVELIALERDRQLKKAWTAEHDDEHRIGQLADAASAYLWAAHRAPMSALAPPPPLWPFEDEAWRPNDDPIRDLEKAGALIAAEIDRLLRQRDRIIEGIVG
jgi:hypothetical protein